MLNFVTLKPWKTFHYICELCKKILANPGGSFVSLEAKDSQKLTKIKKN